MPGREKLNHHNTPLVSEECEGRVTVNDPTHPLFGRVLTLAGFAYLPGHVQHAQVEIAPGHFSYIPIACTDLSREPRSTPTVVTANAVAELIAAFQAMRIARRAKHAEHNQSQRVEATARQRASGRRRGNHTHSHGGGGQ